MRQDLVDDFRYQCDLRIVGDGLADWYHVGIVLVDWRWIGRLFQYWHYVGGLVMDRQIGTGLALGWWIGDGLADWYRFGVASADFERLSDRLVLG